MSVDSTLFSSAIKLLIIQIILMYKYPLEDCTLAVLHAPAAAWLFLLRAVENKNRTRN